MKHHLRFKNLHPSIVGAAERMFAEKPWELGSYEQEQIGQEFLNDLGETYKVTAPRLMIDRYVGNGYTAAETDSLGDLISHAEITMTEWSIIRLLSSARFHLIEEEAAERIGEADELAWACSLYYRVKPVAFRRLARDGRIPEVTARDTYTSASWQRLVDAGVTLGDDLTVSPVAARDILNEQPQDSDTEIAEIDTQDEPIFRVEDREVTPEVAAGQTLHDAVEQALVPGVDYEESTPANPDWANEDGSVNHDAIAAEFDDGLDALNRDAIRALARENGIPRGEMNKTELIAALREVGVRA